MRKKPKCMVRKIMQNFAGLRKNEKKGGNYMFCV